MYKWIAVICCCGMLSGCLFISVNKTAKLDEEMKPFTAEKGHEIGLPDQVYFIGGGFNIDFIAPSAGTMFFVDAPTARYLATRSMKAGERFEMAMTDDDFEMLKKQGIDSKTADLRAYFVPEQKMKFVELK